ncbi:MAG TPA: hypothetical protein VEK07_18115 [Polyangiaceae bacterium]|nr:hypothetical protein [Polyangiaceae bacterium]
MTIFHIVGRDEWERAKKPRHQVPEAWTDRRQLFLGPHAEEG